MLWYRRVSSSWTFDICQRLIRHQFSFIWAHNLYWGDTKYPGSMTLMSAILPSSLVIGRGPGDKWTYRGKRQQVGVCCMESGNCSGSVYCLCLGHSHDLRACQSGTGMHTARTYRFAVWQWWQREEPLLNFRHQMTARFGKQATRGDIARVRPTRLDPRGTCTGFVTVTQSGLECRTGRWNGSWWTDIIDDLRSEIGNERMKYACLDYIDDRLNASVYIISVSDFRSGGTFWIGTIHPW